MAMTEIGEVMISTRNNDYLFRPSFAAMTRIGDPGEIVQTFYDIHDTSNERLIVAEVARMSSIGSMSLAAYRQQSGKEGNPAWLLEHLSSNAAKRKAFMASVAVIQACCEIDCSELTGEMIPSRRRSDGLVWRSGIMPFTQILIVAASLITHGVIGKAKVRQLQRNESGGMVSEFKAIEYINSARVHFGMPYAEAERLTMTEFILLLNAKYPEQKGYTREEYDQTADDYFARRERRREIKPNNPASV